MVTLFLLLFVLFQMFKWSSATRLVQQQYLNELHSIQTADAGNAGEDVQLELLILTAQPHLVHLHTCICLMTLLLCIHSSPPQYLPIIPLPLRHSSAVHLYFASQFSCDQLPVLPAT